VPARNPPPRRASGGRPPSANRGAPKGAPRPGGQSSGGPRRSPREPDSRDFERREPRDGAERRIDRSKARRPSSVAGTSNEQHGRPRFEVLRGACGLGAMTATTEILAVPNGAPDRVAPGETDGPPADRRPRDGPRSRVVMTARVRRVRALTFKDSSTSRAPRPNDRRPSSSERSRSARPTGASTSTPVIGGRACRRAIVHRVERDRSVDPGN